jgi:hypothetical protein
MEMISLPDGLAFISYTKNITLSLAVAEGTQLISLVWPFFRDPSPMDTWITARATVLLVAVTICYVVIVYLQLRAFLRDRKEIQNRELIQGLYIPIWKSLSDILDHRKHFKVGDPRDRSQLADNPPMLVEWKFLGKSFLHWRMDSSLKEQLNDFSEDYQKYCYSYNNIKDSIRDIIHEVVNGSPYKPDRIPYDSFIYSLDLKISRTKYPPKPDISKIGINNFLFEDISPRAYREKELADLGLKDDPKEQKTTYWVGFDKGGPAEITEDSFYHFCDEIIKKAKEKETLSLYFEVRKNALEIIVPLETAIERLAKI